MRKNCKENEIYNPKTNKCVLKTGKIGKELLKQQQQEKEQEREKNVTNGNDILNELCVKWLMKKLKDPLTKETIMEKSINYKYYNSICKKNESLIDKTSISPKMETKEAKETKVTKVTKEPKVKETKETKEPKVKETKVTKEAKEIKINKKACIEKKGKELILADKIKLVKQFGSKSIFGINFISSFIDNPDFQFSAKIQFSTKEGKKELKILQIMNEYRVKNNYIHFPVMYDYTICPVMTNVEDLPDFFKAKTRSKSYITILNELLSGDLYNYILKIANNNYELLLNAIEQIYMCLASLHSFGLRHNDSHSGNFLFKEIEPGGYFHYIINGTDYYIPNIGYLWVIWDFGVSSEITRHYDYPVDYNFLNLSFRHNDESRITTKFKNKYELDEKDKKYRNWGNVDKSVKIPSRFVELVEYLWESSGSDEPSIIGKLDTEELSEDKWFGQLLKSKNMFNHKPKVSDKIVNTTIINFQKVTKDKFNILINKKAFPFDLSFMEKFN